VVWNYVEREEGISTLDQQAKLSTGKPKSTEMTGNRKWERNQDDPEELKEKEEKGKRTRREGKDRKTTQITSHTKNRRNLDLDRKTRSSV
jgi:hypothetical protein